MEPGAPIPFARLIPRADPTTRKRLDPAVVAAIDSTVRSAPERKGRGVHVLFAGVSGTGRTLAAQVFAQSLGMDLYRVDLGAVVSKHIGETEKNLAGVLAAAERSGVVLFFDEGDEIFGKRTAASDAPDRYANLETQYLLQRFEEHAGPVILATNRVQDIDEAFLRRCACVIRIVEAR